MATVTLNACQAGLTGPSNAQEVPFFTMSLPPASLLLLQEVKLEGGENASRVKMLVKRMLDVKYGKEMLVSCHKGY